MLEHALRSFSGDAMNINSLCIGDSEVVEYRLENRTLTMIFKDYTETSYEIVMTDCRRISVKGSVGFSLSTATFVNNATGDHWRFYDSDGAVMELEFNGYTMKRIDSRS